MQASNVSTINLQSSQSQSSPLPSKKKAKKKTVEKTQQAVKNVQPATDLSSQKQHMSHHNVNLNNTQASPNYNFFQYSVIFSSGSLVLYIPVAELPKNYITKKYQNSELKNFSYETELDIEKREKKWRANHAPTQVFEVITLKPLKLRKMKTLEFIRKTNVRDLYTVFERLGEEYIRTIEISDTNTDQTKLKIPRQINPLTAVDPQLLMETIHSGIFAQSVLASELLTQLKKNLAKCISKFGSELSPYEPMHLMWDSLSQLIIKKQPFNELQKEQCTQAMLKYWEKVRYSQYTFPILGSIGKHNASEYLNETIQQLTSLPCFLRENLTFKNETLCHELESVHLPLLNFYKSIAQLKINELGTFFNDLNNFNNYTKLNDWYDCKISLNSSRIQIQGWLHTRIDLIIQNLTLNSDNSDLQSLLIDCHEIKTALQKQNWLDAYNKICTLYRQLLELNTAKDPVPANVDTKNKVFQISPQRMGLFRSFEFVKALYNEFLSIVSDGKLYNVVSECAYEELQKSSKPLEIPIAQKQILHTEFKDWARNLSDVNYKEIFDTLQVMKQAWNELKALQAKIKNPDDNIEKSLQILFKIVDSQNYSNLMEAYEKLSQQIKDPLNRWVQQLKILNQAIHKLQDHCILILLDPQLPKIDLTMLKSQFLLFNSRLAELIKPTTSFFNAFQQLICIDPTSFKGVSENSNKIFLTFTDEGAFTLNLFETNDDYFSKLETQLEQIRQIPNVPLIVEIEEEYSESVPFDDKEIVSPKIIEDEQSHQIEKLTEDVRKIFQGNTKTRRIKKELTQLLKDYDIHFNAKFGKGDHNKLYVTEIPISLPEHKEWKPGTLHSIQNSVIKMLQERIKKEKE